MPLERFAKHGFPNIINSGTKKKKNKKDDLFLTIQDIFQDVNIKSKFFKKKEPEI